MGKEGKRRKEKKSRTMKDRNGGEGVGGREKRKSKKQMRSTEKRISVKNRMKYRIYGDLYGTSTT